MHHDLRGERSLPSPELSTVKPWEAGVLPPPGSASPIESDHGMDELPS